MRSLLLLLLVALVACGVSGTPIDPTRWLINRPTEGYPRLGRSVPQTKGGEVPVRGRVPLTRQPALKKGEYMCGSRICKLQPGEVPKNCNGVCQYPVGLFKK